LVLPEFYPQLSNPEPPFGELEKAEKEYIGVGHGKAGAWLGEQFGLPQPYLDVMHYHHAPRRAVVNKLPVALVTLADLFATECGESFGGQAKEAREEVLRSEAWALIKQNHTPFRDADIPCFVGEFRWELEKSWPQITGNIP